MNIEEQNEQIIKQLIVLNGSIRKQSSVMYNIRIGMIYGIGFFIGSAIIATIALGIFGPMLGKVSWIGDNFSKGNSILQAR